MFPFIQNLVVHEFDNVDVLVLREIESLRFGHALTV